MGLFSSSEYDELNHLIEKATSEYIPAAQENLALNLEITDVIKSKRVDAKNSLRLLLARLVHENPNVQLLTLQLLDKCVKNGGKHFLIEMAGREFVDVAVSLMDDEEDGQECNQMVQDRLIELFQEWALVFQSDPDLMYLYDAYCALKLHKRVIFPTPPASMDHLDPISIVSTAAPPEWSDNAACMRCRDVFSFTNRKHHCRRCGGVFCQQCSSNLMAILEMGIIDPVRVCDKCYSQSQPTSLKSTSPSKSKIEGARMSSFNESEEADFKKAVELSLQEAQPQYTTIPSSEDLMLKKAIEASLKDVQPQYNNHKQSLTQTQLPAYFNSNSNPSTNTSKTQSISESEAQSVLSAVYNKDTFKLEYFNSIELENITMFHQLIMKLLKTRPILAAADTLELKALAEEMRKMARRPLENEKVKRELEEGLRGFNLLMEKEQEHQQQKNSMFIRGSSADIVAVNSNDKMIKNNNTTTTNDSVFIRNGNGIDTSNAATNVTTSSHYLPQLSHQKPDQQLPSFQSIQAQLSKPSHAQYHDDMNSGYNPIKSQSDERGQQPSLNYGPNQNEMVRSRLGSLSLENINVNAINGNQAHRNFMDHQTTYPNPTFSQHPQVLLPPRPVHPVVINPYSPPIVSFQNPYAASNADTNTETLKTKEEEEKKKKKKYKKSKKEEKEEKEEKSKKKKKWRPESDSRSENENENESSKGTGKAEEKAKKKKKGEQQQHKSLNSNLKTTPFIESKLLQSEPEPEPESEKRKDERKRKRKRKGDTEDNKVTETATAATTDSEVVQDVDNDTDLILLPDLINMEEYESLTTETIQDTQQATTTTTTEIERIKSSEKKKKEVINLIDL